MILLPVWVGWSIEMCSVVAVKRCWPVGHDEYVHVPINFCLSFRVCRPSESLAVALQQEILFTLDSWLEMLKPTDFSICCMLIAQNKRCQLLGTLSFAPDTRENCLAESLHSFLLTWWLFLMIPNVCFCCYKVTEMEAFLLIHIPGSWGGEIPLLH